MGKAYLVTRGCVFRFGLVRPCSGRPFDNLSNGPSVVRPSMGDSRSPDPGSNPGRSTIEFWFQTANRRAALGTATTMTDTMSANRIVGMPSPSAAASSAPVTLIGKAPSDSAIVPVESIE